MKNEQYDRWKDFSLRMVRTCYHGNRRPTSRWITEVVANYFDCIDERDVPCIVNWDHSDPHEESTHGRESRRSYCGCDGYRHEHGTPNPECPECGGSGLHYALHSGRLVCCDVDEFLADNYRGNAPDCEACLGEFRQYATYARGRDPKCRCDDIEDRYYEQWDEQWGGPVHCCIRAGLDFAAGPSAGVLGFTAGDVRRMYPEGVPEWVFPPGDRLHHWPNGPVNGTFAELPDSAGVLM